MEGFKMKKLLLIALLSITISSHAMFRFTVPVARTVVAAQAARGYAIKPLPKGTLNAKKKREKIRNSAQYREMKLRKLAANIRKCKKPEDINKIAAIMERHVTKK